MCVWASYLVNILESTNFFKSSPRPQKFPLVRLRNAPTPGLPHGHRSKDGQGPRRDALLDTGAHGRVVSQSTSLQSAVMTSTNIKLYSTSQATIIWYRSRITTNNNTYDHRTLKIRLPVRSAIYKQCTGGLVVRWVTTSESPLLYVFVLFVASYELGARQERLKGKNVWWWFFFVARDEMTFPQIRCSP
jgi:hypothetical protein